MPINYDGKDYSFQELENHIKKTKPDIKSPGGYVKEIEMKEKGARLKGRFAVLQRDVKQVEGKSQDVLKLKGNERPPFISKGTGSEESSSKQITTEKDPVKIQAKSVTAKLLKLADMDNPRNYDLSVEEEDKKKKEEPDSGF